MTKGGDDDDDRKNFSKWDELNDDGGNNGDHDDDDDGGNNGDHDDDDDDVGTAKAEAVLGDLVQKITHKAEVPDKQRHNIPWKV